MQLDIFVHGRPGVCTVHTAGLSSWNACHPVGGMWYPVATNKSSGRKQKASP